VISAFKVATWLPVLCLLLAPGPASGITVKDDRGEFVVLDKPARRVVALAPFLTELVYAVGGGGRLVGVSEHSDYPPAARDLPRVGNAFSVKMEKLLAVRPDLVLLWQSGNDPRIRQRLETMGIRVFVLEPRDISGVPRSLERIGRLLGLERAAEEKALGFTADIQAIRRRYAARDRVRVFYQVASEPLITLSGRHMVTSILELCGGRNIFRDLSPIAPAVNREEVVARDPEAILISSRDDDAGGFQEYWSRYAAITAVRLENIFSVNADLINRQTPRLVAGARQVCARLDQARARLAADRS